MYTQSQETPLLDLCKFIDLTLNFQHGSVPDSKVNIFVRLNGLHFVTYSWGYLNEIVSYSCMLTLKRGFYTRLPILTIGE